MVVYDSQYRKSFEDPHWDTFAVDEYRRKLNYRLGRRSVEQEHQSWDWDSEEEVLGSERVVKPCSSSVAEKHEREQAERREKHHRGKDSVKSKAKDAVREKGVVKPPQQDAHKVEDLQKQRQQYQQQKDKVEKQHEHVQRDQRRKPKRRPKTAPLEKETETLTARQPFVSYGWANQAPLEKKYTYNVRANQSEVYPASMRALKRRQLEIKRKQFENEQKATIIERELARERLLKASEVSSAFLTEYQRSYCLLNDAKLGYNSD